jgi:hypothetical protein
MQAKTMKYRRPWWNNKIWGQFKGGPWGYRLRRKKPTVSCPFTSIGVSAVEPSVYCQRANMKRMTDEGVTKVKANTQQEPWMPFADFWRSQLGFCDYAVMFTAVAFISQLCDSSWFGDHQPLDIVTARLPCCQLRQCSTNEYSRQLSRLWKSHASCLRRGEDEHIFLCRCLLPSRVRLVLQ